MKQEPMSTEVVQVCEAGNNFDLYRTTHQILVQHGLIFGTEEDMTDVEGDVTNMFSMDWKEQQILSRSGSPSIPSGREIMPADNARDLGNPKAPQSAVNPPGTEYDDDGSDMSVSDEEPKESNTQLRKEADDCSDISVSGPVKSNTQLRKEKKAQLRRKAQKMKKTDKKKRTRLWGPREFKRGLFDDTIEHKVADLDISKLAHTKPGFIGMPTTTHPSKDFEIQVVQALTSSSGLLHPLCDQDVQQKFLEGWHYIKNDLSSAQVISDCHGQKIAVKTCQPRPPTWSAIKSGAFAAIKEAREEVEKHLQPLIQRSSSVPLKTRQHDPAHCRHVTLGVSCGSGQARPMVLRFQTQTEARVARNLLQNPYIIQLVNHVTASLWAWYPELAEMYYLLQARLDIFNQLLSNIFSESPFCGTTFNLGPKASTFEHRDSKNLIGGICAIIVLGTFNHETSGHLLLHELKTIMEVHDGDVVFLPSAGVAHSNSKLRVGEDRCSIVQYTAGGNFRSTWPTEKQDAGIETEIGKKRWEECLELLGSVADLEVAKRTGKLPKRNMEELVNRGDSALLPPSNKPM